jgi:hypothetical protein
VPAALLGSRHNRQVLRAAVDRLVRCRRFEVVRLQQLAAGLKTTHMPWLASRRQQQQQRAAAVGGSIRGRAAAGRGAVPCSLLHAQQRWLHAWLWWLLVQLVLPLLRNGFYVTESEPYRQAVFYYRCAR